MSSSFDPPSSSGPPTSPGPPLSSDPPLSTTASLKAFVSFGENYRTRKQKILDRDMEIAVKGIGVLRAEGRAARIEIE